MGLKVHTLERLPDDGNREYFVYLLDYGWDGPLQRAMMDNFDQIADQISGHRGVVVAGLSVGHFSNNVLSWHQVNGQPADDILPALLVTDCHPNDFKKLGDDDQRLGSEKRPGPDRLILVPLRKLCRTEAEVVEVIQNIVQDIRAGRSLSDFQVQQMVNPKRGLADALVLQPNFNGIGLDLKRVPW